MDGNLVLHRQGWRRTLLRQAHGPRLGQGPVVLHPERILTSFAPKDHRIAYPSPRCSRHVCTTGESG